MVTGLSDDSIVSYSTSLDGPFAFGLDFSGLFRHPQTAAMTIVIRAIAVTPKPVTTVGMIMTIKFFSDE
jgi:hypothetical protein